MRLGELGGMAYAYGASLVSYRTGGAPRPFSAAFAVTNRCNIHCSYCNCPAMDPTNLPMDRIRVLFARLRALGVRRLGLVGGEPLLRPDIADIVDLAKDMRFFVSLNSNLMLYKRDPSVMDRVDLVFTSLDGDAAAHRRNRGANSYDGVLEAIADLRRRGKPVVAICVVAENNMDQAEFLLARAEELDFRVHFQAQCDDAEIFQGKISPTLDNERFRAFWRGLAHEKKRGRPIASSEGYLEFLSGWQDFRVPSYSDPQKTCAAGRGFICVDYRADVYPCPYTKGKVEPANLLEDGWRADFQAAYSKPTPCTTCMVGPMLEFNLLFNNPVGAVLDALSAYGR